MGFPIRFAIPDKSGSLRSGMGLKEVKHLTSFGVQTPLRGFQSLLRSVQISMPGMIEHERSEMFEFLNTAKQWLNAERSEAIERRLAAIEFFENRAQRDA